MFQDKWRNLSVAPGIQGSKDKIRTPKIKAAAFHLASAAAAATCTLTTPIAISSPVATLLRSKSSDLSIDDSFNIVVDAKNAPRFVFFTFFSEPVLNPVPIHKCYKLLVYLHCYASDEPLFYEDMME